MTRAVTIEREGTRWVVSVDMFTTRFDTEAVATEWFNFFTEALASLAVATNDVALTEDQAQHAARYLGVPVENVSEHIKRGIPTARGRGRFYAQRTCKMPHSVRLTDASGEFVFSAAGETEAEAVAALIRYMEIRDEDGAFQAADLRYRQEVEG